MLLKLPCSDGKGLKYYLLWRTVAPKRIERLSWIWAHFKEQCLLFKMSPSWGQFVNSFRRYMLLKLPCPDGKGLRYYQLWRTVAPKRIEQLSSIWAHFKELCLLFKMSPSWGQKLNSFRRYELKKLPYPIWMAESGLYQQPPEKWN